MANRIGFGWTQTKKLWFEVRLRAFDCEWVKREESDDERSLQRRKNVKHNSRVLAHTERMVFFSSPFSLVLQFFSFFFCAPVTMGFHRPRRKKLKRRRKAAHISTQVAEEEDDEVRVDGGRCGEHRLSVCCCCCCCCCRLPRWWRRWQTAIELPRKKDKRRRICCAQGSQLSSQVHSFSRCFTKSWNKGCSRGQKCSETASCKMCRMGPPRWGCEEVIDRKEKKRFEAAGAVVVAAVAFVAHWAAPSVHEYWQWVVVIYCDQPVFTDCSLLMAHWLFIKTRSLLTREAHFGSLLGAAKMNYCTVSIFAQSWVLRQPFCSFGDAEK